MLLQVDLGTFRFNIYLIIGALILLLVLFVLLFSLWTGLSMWWWHIQRRRAYEKWIETSRRADGAPYPPFIEGVCAQCGRGDRKIYFSDTGEELCPTCYEAAWRLDELLAEEQAQHEENSEKTQEGVTV